MNAPEWNPNQALDEGWILLPNPGPDGWRIVSGTKHALYSNDPLHRNPLSVLDDLALAFVQHRAREGSAYHIEALMIAQFT